MTTLRKAYELLQDRDNWTQGIAVDLDGRVCAMGAITRSAGLPGCEEWQIAANALDAAAVQLFPKSAGHGLVPIAWVNDHIGYSEVIQCFEKAIVELEGGL